MYRFLVAIMMLLCTTFECVAQNYDEMWAEVDELKSRDLPRSAIEKLDGIVRTADRKGHFAWAARARFERMMLRADICPDSMAVDVERLSEELGSEMSWSDELVLHALTGEAYGVLARKSRANMGLRSEYEKKSKKHFALSMSDWGVLAESSADDYKPLMRIVGNDRDTRLYGDDMLNVLAVYSETQTNMPTEERCELYDSLSRFYSARGNRNAALLTRMESLTCLRRLNGGAKRLSLEAYKDSLLVLARRNKDIEAGADAYMALVGVMGNDEREMRLGVVDEALMAFPHSVRKEFFESVKAELNRGHVSANIIMGSYVPVKVVVEHERVGGCRISFYHHGKKHIEASEDLVFADNEERYTDTMRFALTPGNYRMKLEYGTVSDTTNVNVTSMYMVAASYRGDNNVITVVDGTSGRPLENVPLSVRNRKGELTEDTSTDGHGQAFVVGKEYGLKVIADAGNYDKTEIGYMTRWGGMGDEESQDKRISLFSDRAVYRPGQTVNVAVVAYNQKGDETYVLKDEEMALTLHDTKGKEVGRKVVKTNAMGSTSANFELSKECMPGVYVVKADGKHDHTLRVEEYKRPTFEVEMATGQTGYALGDSVVVCGKAMTFSGVPVQNATVKYKVEYRNLGFWYRHNASWGMVASGTITTDDEGRFEVQAYLDPNKMDNRFRLLQYRVTAEVVSGAGETQQGECRLMVSPNSFGLMAEAPSVVLMGSGADICVKAMSLDGKEMEVQCEYGIFNLRSGEIVDKGRTMKSVVLPKGLKPGDYRIEFAATDSITDFATGGERVDTVKAETNFTLFDPKAKTMDVARDFIYSTTDEISDKQHADICFMPEHKGVTLYWMLVAGDSLIDKGVKRVGDEMQKFRINYKKELGDGMKLVIFYVKDFRLHYREKSVTLIKPDKSLDIKWKVFRDKLMPGQQETWSLSVRDSKGRPVNAEMLATMYDASLDKIAPHEWTFNIDFMRRGTPISMVGSLLAFGNCHVMTDIPSFDIKGRSFDRLIDWGDGVVLNEVFAMKLGSPPTKSMALYGRVSGLEIDTSANGTVTEESADVGAGEVRKVRSDFAETAFFYPHIMTNKKGEATISFTLPESMTEWRFMGLAHTDDMKYGQVRGTVVASKDFMVQPNMPRFVRVGDSVSIASNIINRTDSLISGEATMTLLDPETEEIVAKDKMSFSVEAGKTTTVEFKFNVVTSLSCLVCQIEAENEQFSDGERNNLPVLSDKQLITTTIPFFLDGTEEKVLNISNLFNNGSESATDCKLTIEYNGSPAWMAVEALKSVSVPDVDNAVSVSAALYANLAAEHIAKSIDDKFCVDSVADFLDKNNMDSRRLKAEDKLRKLQNEDGSWSWFEGMNGNLHITSKVAEHIAEAELLTGKYCTLHDEMLKAMAWMDAEELERYERLKKMKDWSGIPSESTLRYLYVCSLVERDADSVVMAMQKEYLNKAEQMIGDLTIYGRANIACVLDKWGRKDKAFEFVQSLREYTVSNDEMGRYYDTGKAKYSWCDFRMPTHLAAMKAMRLFNSELADGQKYINEMTLWIIQQKRTQEWDTPINTVGAVNELLQNNALDNKDGVRPKFVIDDKVLTETEMAEGVYDLYNMDTLHIIPLDDDADVSWGAVYGQCVEDIREVESASTTSFSITRKMQVERTRDGIIQWEEVDGDYVLNVGDKVRIRYTLETDRDMDFVCVKSMHPACFEPLERISGHKWMGTCSAYVAQYDQSTDFYFDYVRKGSMTFDQEMYVAREGVYTVGITTAQCTYAPEFSSRTSGSIVRVGK